jgi:hypothetical protein
MAVSFFGLNHRHRRHFADEIGEQALVIGERCWTSMKVMPLIGRHNWRKNLEGTQPPADAPMPTINEAA